MTKNFIPDGCIFLARKVQSSDIWNKPSDWLKVFVHVLQEVNHKGNSYYERGTNFFNLVDVARDCRVSRNTVYKFIKWGKSAKLLATRKTTRGVVLSVLNYNKYQTLENYKGDTDGDTSGETEAKQKRNRSDTINKNDKNDKKEKNTYTCSSLLDRMCEIIGYSIKTSATKEKYLASLSSRLKEYTEEELVRAWEAMANNEYLVDNKHLKAEYALRPTKVEEWVNKSADEAPPKPKERKVEEEVLTRPDGSKEVTIIEH